MIHLNLWLYFQRASIFDIAKLYTQDNIRSLNLLSYHAQA